MTDVLLKGEVTQTHRPHNGGDRDGGIQLLAGQRQGRLGATGSWKRQARILPLSLQGAHGGPCRHLDFRLLRTMREYVSVALSHAVCYDSPRKLTQEY